MGAVTVFLLPSPAAAGHAAACLAWLDRDERARAAAFARLADAGTYIAAHALLRAALSTVARAHGVDMAPGAWRYALAQRGKPHLVRGTCPLDLRFSLSHCDGLVAAAVGAGVEVGLDVERESRHVPAALRIARLRLSRQDHAALEAIADPTRQGRRFMALWTELEAVAKGTGQGLAMRRDTRSVQTNGGGTGNEGAAERRQHWHLSRWRLGDHVIALAAAECAAAPPAECRVVAWDGTKREFVDSAEWHRLETRG